MWRATSTSTMRTGGRGHSVFWHLIRDQSKVVNINIVCPFRKAASAISKHPTRIENGSEAKKLVRIVLTLILVWGRTLAVSLLFPLEWSW